MHLKSLSVRIGLGQSMGLMGTLVINFLVIHVFSCQLDDRFFEFVGHRLSPFIDETRASCTLLGPNRCLALTSCLDCLHKILLLRQSQSIIHPVEIGSTLGKIHVAMLSLVLLLLLV